MNPFVEILRRLVPGTVEEVPPQVGSVTDGTARDPLSSREANRGLARGVFLDTLLAIPDTITTGINKLPTGAGALVRGVVGGPQGLPSAGVADATGLSGSGPAYDTGRAFGNALVSALTLGANVRPAPQGQVNMLIGSGAAGYDKERTRAFIETLKKLGLDARPGRMPQEYKIAEEASKAGMVYDPGTRQVLQYLDTSGWKLAPDFSGKLQWAHGAQEDLPISKLFQKPENAKSLLHGFWGGNPYNTLKVRPDPYLESGAIYYPTNSLVKVPMHGATEASELKDSLLHELQHHVAQVGRFSQGTNEHQLAAAEYALRNLRWRQNTHKKLLDTERSPLTPVNKVIDQTLRTSRQEGYRGTIGEILAFHATDVGNTGIPARGLNVFDDPAAVIGGLQHQNYPLKLVNHLTEMRVKHPALWEKVANRYPELRNIPSSQRLQGELEDYAHFLGMDTTPTGPRK